MSGLHKPGEFRRRNQGNVARSSSSNDNSFLLVYHPVEHGGEVLAETGIRRFARHGVLEFIVQHCCTFFASAMLAGTQHPDTELTASR